MYKTNNLFFYICVYFLSTSTSHSESANNCSRCAFNHHHKSTSASIEKLKPLCGKRFQTHSSDGSIFSYNLGICTSALIAETRPDYTDTGMIQKDSSQSVSYKLGSIKKADLKMGTNWLMLEYSGGEEYKKACAKAPRTTTVLLICDPNEQQGRLEYLEEQNVDDNSNKCYYLFQLSHRAVCSPEDATPTSSSSSDWSVGSIVCFIILITTACYFGVGVLYRRVVKKKRGIHQLPNFQFWRELGHLQADGCNLVCRCADRHVNNYSGDLQQAGSNSNLVNEEQYN